jgi:hypothetical protein
MPLAFAALFRCQPAANAAASQDFRRQPLRDYDADYAALTAMHFHFRFFTLFTATHEAD